MRETYIRPWYKTLGYFMLFELEIIAMMLFVCLTMGAFAFKGGLSNMVEGTIFGTVPLWFTFFAAFIPTSPFFAFALYFGMAPKKYDLEWRKLNLVPYHPEDHNQVLFYPRKIRKQEPVWKENTEFNATIKVAGQEYMPTGHGSKEYMVVEDGNGYKYLMSLEHFAPIAMKMVNGIYTGNFIFDISWRWPSLKEVVNA